MLTGFFDASGTPDNAKPPALVVAGFVATVASWDAFQIEWDALLARHDIKVPFHTTDFHAGWNGFEAFRNDPTRRDKFVAEAVNTIQNRIQDSFVSGVYLHVLKEVGQIYDLPEEVGRPYPLCGFAIVQKLEHWMGLSKVNKAHMRYCFEHGDLDAEYLTKACSKFGKLQGRDLIPHFEMRNTIAALQAADLLAWVVAAWTIIVDRAVAEGHVPGSIPPPSWLKLAAEKFGPEMWGLTTKKDLLAYCEGQGFKKRLVAP